MGVSAPGIDAIVRTCQADARLRREILTEINDDQWRFAKEVVGRARERLGKARTQEGLARKDFESLARASGMTKQKVAELYAVWRRDASAEAGLASILTLRDLLTADDWVKLRYFLFTEVAPTYSYDYFGEGAFR
jgi:hypothetical protein